MTHKLYQLTLVAFNLSLVKLSTFTITVMAPSFPVLEFNCFLFFNKKFSGNVVSAWGRGKYDVKAGADPMSLDQIWITKPDPHYVGYFYIENVVHDGCRLCLLGSGERDIGLVSGETVKEYGEEQLWQFAPKGDGYFQVINKRYRTALTIWDNGSTFGVKENGAGDEQVWKMEPRYKCEIVEEEIFSVDNSEGTKPLKAPFEISIGVKMLYPDYLIKTSFFPHAVKAAMVSKVLDRTITYFTFTELKMEQWRSETKETYAEWYDTLIVPFVAYQQRKYRITQFVAKCTGRLETDQCEVRGPWKAYN